jgi:hypothetical protein
MRREEGGIMPGWLRVDEAIAPEDEATQAQGAYHQTDPRIEQAAAAYTQERLQAQYFEARFQAEQRAIRGHAGAAFWAIPLYAALWLPGFLCCSTALARAHQDYDLCGVRGPGYGVLMVETFLVGPVTFFLWIWLIAVALGG